MRKVLCALAITLLASGCGDSGDDGAKSTTSTTGEVSDGVPASIGGVIDGAITGDINVLGFVVIEPSGVRFCASLAESFPPQCGEPSLDLVDLDPAVVELEEAQGVQWTDDIVVLLGRYSDGSFTVIDVG
jgi:hypothetical protein